jgi:hypothetical protein
VTGSRRKRDARGELERRRKMRRRLGVLVLAAVGARVLQKRRARNDTFDGTL